MSKYSLMYQFILELLENFHRLKDKIATHNRIGKIKEDRAAQRTFKDSF